MAQVVERKVYHSGRVMKSVGSTYRDSNVPFSGVKRIKIPIGHNLHYYIGHKIGSIIIRNFLSITVTQSASC
jgi:hypothetical protein